MRREPQSSRYRYLTFLLVFGFALFHLWYIHRSFLDLAPDEAHYWEWSRHLDWSYYSKGPMVAYLIAASTRLCGATESCVRLPAVLLALGTATVVFLFTRKLFASERAGFLAVLICSVIPLFAAGSMLMTIDAPLVFFWMLALFSVQGAVDRSALPVKGPKRQWGWWLLLALSLGLGLQSKYTMLLFLPCLVSYMVVSPYARPYLQKKEFYLALFLGFLLFAPVIIWNARHQWVSLWHVMGQAGLLEQEVHFSIKNFFEFLGSQIGVISPLLFFALVGAMIRSGKRGWGEREDTFLFLFLLSSPFLAFFLLWSVYEKVQGNWAAPAYLAAAVALAGWWDELLARAENSRRSRILAAVFSIVLLPGVLLVAIGHFPDALKWVGIELSPQLDPTKRLRGWKELGIAVGRITRNARDGEMFLVSDSYQVASELAFYVSGQPRVYNLNLGRRMNQYDIWGGLDGLQGRDLLFVTYGDGEAHHFIREACRELKRVEVVTIFHRGNPVQAFSIFYCERYKGLILPQEKRAY
jgi:4-amino-4-deoxy-L-arabinose transferase-like glycosyltransferase